MKNLKISAKITASFLIVAVLSGLAGVVGLITVSAEHRNINLLNKRMGLGIAAARMTHNVHEQRAAFSCGTVYYYLGNRDAFEKSWKDVQTLSAVFESYAARLKEMLVLEESQLRLRQFKNEYAEFAAVREMFFAMFRDEDIPRERVNDALKNLSDISIKLSRTGMAFTDYIDGVTDRQVADSRRLTRRVVLFLFFLILVAVNSALILGGYTARIISRPVNACIDRIKKLLDEGDLHSPVEVFDSNDESGKLSRIMRDTVSTYGSIIREQARILSSMAGGNYVHQHIMTYNGDLAAIKDANNMLQNSLNTARQRAEEAQTKSKAAMDDLVRKTYHLDIVAEISKFTYWEFNVETDRLAFSYHFTEEFGYSPGEIKSVGYNDRVARDPPSKWIDIVHPEDRGHILQELNDYVMGETNLYRSELRIRNKKGEYLWALTAGRAVKWIDGRPSLMIGGLFNINDIKKTESASTAKSQFLASMSHEIRTPMNAIIGMSELIRTDNLDSHQLMFVNDIKNMSRMLLQIINDILDFSKIEAGKMELNCIHFNLRELYDEISSLNHFLANSKGLEFKRTFSDDVPRIVYGDDVRIRQIITNLLNNAVKYTTEGMVHFRVRLAREESGEYIVFEVEDTGIGIRPEDFQRVFETFEQVDRRKNRSITGTGLGLPISRRLVELMNGRIEIQSEYGKGSVFAAFLPLVKGDPSKVAQSETVNRIVTSGAVKVLVVDDSSVNLKVALAYLETYNIHADTAGSGAEALQMIRQKQYHLIFMDHMMPEMDGLEVAARIRSMSAQWCKEVPIVALSANALTGVRELFLENGMNDFVSKPINAVELNRTLLKWLPRDLFALSKPMETKNRPAPEGHTEAGPIDRAAGVANSAGNETFYLQLLANFRASHSQDIALINEALDKQDYKPARLIAHTLKSTATLIGAQALSAAAQAAEHALAGGDFNLTGIRENLGREHAAVLRELAEMIPAEAEQTASGGELDKARALALIKKLEPLLKINSTDCLNLLDDIRKTLSPAGPAAAQVISFIESFDFAEAFAVTKQLKKKIAG
ncbi:MAG: response regulator [Treponema sp.]|nr:response regulator [Treponema sp.]